jgi:DNA-binding NarL/FixJ family response regulator
MDLTTTGIRSLATELETDANIPVYLAMLRLAEPTEQALIDVGFTAEEVQHAVSVLIDRRLIDRVGDGFAVPPPEVAIPAYAADLERQARTSRAAAAGLSQLYHRARSATQDDEQASGERGSRRITSPEGLDRHSFRIVAAARERIVHVVARSVRNDVALLEGLVPMTSAEHDDVEHVLVVDSSFLEVEGAMAALATLRDAGVRVSLVPGVPFTALAVDAASAILDLTNLDPAGESSALLHHRVHVAAVRTVLERIVLNATPLPRGLHPALPARSERDSQILALLAAGASDSTIARQVGVSQRTVERRLRAIMDSLGATTRFQAGAQAVRRGLI